MAVETRGGKFISRKWTKPPCQNCTEECLKKNRCRIWSFQSSMEISSYRAEALSPPNHSTTEFSEPTRSGDSGTIKLLHCSTLNINPPDYRDHNNLELQQVRLICPSRVICRIEHKTSSYRFTGMNTVQLHCEACLFCKDHY